MGDYHVGPYRPTCVVLLRLLIKKMYYFTLQTTWGVVNHDNRGKESARSIHLYHVWYI